MKIFIIEDEKAAVRNLRALITEVCPDGDVVGCSDCVSDSVEWFMANEMPDLVFMDIHLADGSAFEIFEHVNITCPIIFTTAYDEYALRAFKVNSIDYLLKPIGRDDLARALDKLKALRKDDNSLVMRIVSQLGMRDKFRTHFLIPVKGDRFVPLAVDSIMYFYISDGIVKAVDSGNRYYAFSQSLDELSEQVDPKNFFRANRQFLVSKKAVKDISIWFNGRLVINLTVPLPTDEKIIISKAKATEFKEWYTVY